MSVWIRFTLQPIDMYKATIVRLPEPRPHPNADRLQIFTIMGYQVITNLSHHEGELGIFFPPDGQVSEEYAQANDLVGYTDEEGNRKGGFMSNKRRVRAINLRGEKSQGLWMPITSIEFLGGNVYSLQVGDELDTYREHQFCNKYYTPATKQAMKKGRKVNRRETTMFHMHADTAKLQQRIDRLPQYSIITVTEKVHGTSGRFGRVLEPIPNGWMRRMLRLPERSEWVELSGSRRVILERRDQVQSFYGSDDFRNEVVDPLRGNLHKGETVFFEIVGWVDEATPIMPAVDTSILRDKAIEQKYGKKMHYKYGCPPGTRKMIVYRITMTNEDGVSHDMTWEQVKQRCRELGVEHAREEGTVYVNHVLDLREDNEYMPQLFLHWCDLAANGPSAYDETHIKEGIAIRFETGEPETLFMKYKSHTFLVLEGHTKGREDYVDLEEAS